MAWFGPSDQGFGWVRDKLYQTSKCKIVDLGSIDEIEFLPDCSRVVFCCRNRLDFPVRAIADLQVRFPFLPLALLVDNWWEGARRTGVGIPGHHIWPWYRWWDTWYDWLGIGNPGNASVIGELFSPIAVPADAALVGNCPPLGNLDRRLFVVALCRETAETWQATGQWCGVDTQWIVPAVFENKIDQLTSSKGESAAEWLLFDDTLLATINSINSDLMADLIRRSASQSRWQGIIVAAKNPRWDQWQQWVEAGASDLIAKPSHGLPLCRVLNSSRFTEFKPTLAN